MRGQAQLPKADQQCKASQSAASWKRPYSSGMKVLVLCEQYVPAFKGGGSIRTLEAMVEAVPPGIEVAVLTNDKDLGSPNRLLVERNQWTVRNNISVYYVSIDKPWKWGRSWLAARRWHPDVIYMNSFFSLKFSILAQILAQIHWWRGSLMVIAPGGEMNIGALALKANKKRLFLQLYKLLKLSDKLIWHASSQDEVTSIRSVFDAKSIIVRENETLLPVKADPPALAGGKVLRAVFLSRISPIKGLDVVLRALKRTSQPVILDIYGPDEDAVYAAKCRLIAQEMPAGVSVEFCGTVGADNVRRVLSKYELFLAPTDGENFGHTIAEALSVSCPVMCTPYTPWTRRLQAGGGVVVANREVAAWAEAIDQYASLSIGERDSRRVLSGRAYLEWRVEEKGPHILDLIFAEHRRINGQSRA